MPCALRAVGGGRKRTKNRINPTHIRLKGKKQSGTLSRSYDPRLGYFRCKTNKKASCVTLARLSIIIVCIVMEFAEFRVGLAAGRRGVAISYGELVFISGNVGSAPSQACLTRETGKSGLVFLQSHQLFARGTPRRSRFLEATCFNCCRTLELTQNRFRTPKFTIVFG